MATFTQEITDDAASAPYGRGIYRDWQDTPSDDSFSAIRSGVGTTLTSTPGAVVKCKNSPTDGYWFIRRTGFGFDMTALPKYINITSASLNLYTQKVNDQIWTDIGSGIVPSLMDESLKSTVGADVNDYQAIFGGFSALVATLKAYSSVAHNDWTVFNFNSTGLAYLNSVMTKSLYTGYAYFGVSLVGDVGDYSPTWGALNESSILISDASDPAYLTFEYDVMNQVNIGDVWKSVAEMQVNIGDAWKDVDSLQANIGDDWKEQV